jgi:hypothetical protein
MVTGAEAEACLTLALAANGPLTATTGTIRPAAASQLRHLFD